MREEDAHSLVAFLGSNWFLAGTVAFIVLVLWLFGWSDTARRRRDRGDGGGSDGGWDVFDSDGGAGDGDGGGNGGD